jgi:hypothetical protein
MRHSRYRKAVQEVNSSRSIKKVVPEKSQRKIESYTETGIHDTSQDAGFLSSLLTFITNIFT